MIKIKLIMIILAISISASALDTQLDSLKYDMKKVDYQIKKLERIIFQKNRSFAIEINPFTPMAETGTIVSGTFSYVLPNRRLEFFVPFYYDNSHSKTGLNIFSTDLRVNLFNTSTLSCVFFDLHAKYIYIKKNGDKNTKKLEEHRVGMGVGFVLRKSISKHLYITTNLSAGTFITDNITTPKGISSWNKANYFGTVYFNMEFLKIGYAF